MNPFLLARCFVQPDKLHGEIFPHRGTKGLDSSICERKSKKGCIHTVDPWKSKTICLIVDLVL